MRAASTRSTVSGNAVARPRRRARHRSGELDQVQRVARRRRSKSRERRVARRARRQFAEQQLIGELVVDRAELDGGGRRRRPPFRSPRDDHEAQLRAEHAGRAPRRELARPRRSSARLRTTITAPGPASASNELGDGESQSIGTERWRRAPRPRRSSPRRHRSRRQSAAATARVQARSCRRTPRALRPAVAASARGSIPAAARIKRRNGRYGGSDLVRLGAHHEPSPVWSRGAAPRATVGSCRRPLRRRARQRLHWRSRPSARPARCRDRPSARPRTERRPTNRRLAARSTTKARTGARLPFTRNGSSGVHSNRDRARVVQPLAGDDLSGRGLGHQPRGQVGCVAHHDVRATLRVTHVADEDDTEVGADAQRQRASRRRCAAGRAADARRRVPSRSAHPRSTSSAPSSLPLGSRASTRRDQRQHGRRCR